MPKSADEIYKDVVDHVGNDDYSTWYAGIAAQPKHRLFEDHNVSESMGRWIHVRAHDNATAREAEKLLHDAGFDGGPGGGDAETTAVYAYKKTKSTVE